MTRSDDERVDPKLHEKQLKSPMGPLMWLFLPLVLVILYAALSH